MDEQHMDDLQLGLIGAGIAVVLGVVAYNALQFAKIRRTVPRIDLPDSLGQNDRQADESVSDRVEYAPPPISDDTLRREPGFGHCSSASALRDDALGEAGGQKIRLPSIVDARIDCIVPLYLDAPVTAEKVIPLMHRLRYVGRKPVL